MSRKTFYNYTLLVIVYTFILFPPYLPKSLIISELNINSSFVIFQMPMLSSKVIDNQRVNKYSQHPVNPNISYSNDKLKFIVKLQMCQVYFTKCKANFTFYKIQLPPVKVHNTKKITKKFRRKGSILYIVYITPSPPIWVWYVLLFILCV